MLDTSKNMQLVIIDLHCDPTIPAGANEAGGGNVYMRQLLKGLERSGIRAIYITRKKYQTLESKAVLPNGAEFYRLDLGDWGPNDKSVLQEYFEEVLSQIRKLLGPCGERKFVFHSSYWHSGKIALTLAQEYHTFFVHTILSNALRKRLQTGTEGDPTERIPWEREIFAAAKYLFCSSVSEAEDIRQLYHVPAERILVTGLVVDSHFCHPDYDLSGMISFDHTLEETSAETLGLPTPAYPIGGTLDWWTAKSFLYFGRLHQDKGLGYIFQAWLRLYQTLGYYTPPLWIAGGTLEGICLFRAELNLLYPDLSELENRNLLVWWGALSPSGIGTLLLRTRAVITHSRYESAGLVILESMAHQVPVLATPFGYGRDLVRDWFNGFQIPYGDVELLYRRMLLFFSHPYLSHLMGINSQYTAKQAENRFHFLENHLFAYGFCPRPAQSDGYWEGSAWTPEQLKRQPLKTFPYQRPRIPEERIRTICSQLGESLIYLAPVSPGEPNRLRARMASGTEFLILRLSAHIRSERLWNRFSFEPSVHTVSEQLNTIQQFGADSGLYTLQWQSDGEGIAVLTMPKKKTIGCHELWALSSAGAFPEYESLYSRWERLGCLISKTPELQEITPAFENAAPEVCRAAQIEQDLPAVSFLPLAGSEPEDAALLPFEQARLASSAVWLLYAQEHMPALATETADWSCGRKTAQAADGWKLYHILANQCRRILLGPLCGHEGEST